MTLSRRACLAAAALALVPPVGAPENKPGGGTIIASQAALAAPADGQLALLVAASIVIQPLLQVHQRSCMWRTTLSACARGSRAAAPCRPRREPFVRGHPADQRVQIGSGLGPEIGTVLQQGPAQPLERLVAALFDAPGLFDRRDRMPDHVELVDVTRALGRCSSHAPMKAGDMSMLTDSIVSGGQ